MLFQFFPPSCEWEVSEWQGGGLPASQGQSNTQFVSKYECNFESWNTSKLLFLLNNIYCNIQNLTRFQIFPFSIF